MDLIIRRASLRGTDGLVDIGIRGGKIAKIASTITEKSTNELPARGRLTTACFVDPHLHLDKAFTSKDTRPNLSGTVGEAVMLSRESKARYTIEDVADRAGRTIESAVANGTTYIRTHVDIDPIVGLTSLHGVLQAKEKYHDLADMEIVAYPQEGILPSTRTEEFLEEAMRLGANVMGGGPEVALQDWDYRAHIDAVFRIAQRHDADIDLHIDLSHDPTSRALEYYALKAIAEGYQGRITASHAILLAVCNDYYAARLIALMKEAEMHVITCPSLNLLLHRRLDRGLVGRGLTRVKELLQAGVNVAYGSDNILDPFNPSFGRADPLEIGLIGAFAIQWSLPEELETLFEMATDRAARLMRIPNYGVAIGNPADLIILDCSDVADAYRQRADRLFVIKKGKIVARTTSSRRVFLEGGPVPVEG